MSVLVDLSVPSEGVVFGNDIYEPDAKVVAERLVPIGSDKVHLWVHGDTERFEQRLEEEGVTYSVVLADEENAQTLYAVERGSMTSINNLMRTVLASDGAVLYAEGSDEGWDFRVRFETREDLSGFGERCDELDLPVSIERVSSSSEVTEQTKESSVTGGGAPTG